MCPSYVRKQHSHFASHKLSDLKQGKIAIIKWQTPNSREYLYCTKGDVKTLSLWIVIFIISRVSGRRSLVILKGTIATSKRHRSVGIHILRRMQPKYYVYIASIAAFLLFLPVTLRLVTIEVEQFPTSKHKIWVILFIGKQCGDLKMTNKIF